MPQNTPMITYGSQENISLWTSSFILVSTTGSADPFGESPAYTVADTSTAQQGHVYKDITLKAHGAHTFDVFLKNINASRTIVQFHDQTTATGAVNYTWTGAVPTPSVRSGNVTVLAPIHVGNNWYHCRAISPLSSGSLLYRIAIYPDGDTVTPTGSVMLDIRNTVHCGYPWQNVVADEQDRDGTVYEQAPSGVEDAWIVGTHPDNTVRGTLRWIPDSSNDSGSQAATGWFGANELTGFNVSVKAMLAAGRAKQTVRVCPLAVSGSTFIDGYLVEPMGDAITPDDGFTRQFTIVLRNPNGYAYEGFRR